MAMRHSSVPIRRTCPGFGRGWPCYLGAQQLRGVSGYGIPSETTTTPRPVATDLSMLKAAAAPVLRQNIPRVIWAGVSGDFAVGEENDYSELDVTVLHEPEEDDPEGRPGLSRALCEALPVAWGRKALVEEFDTKEVPYFWAVFRVLCSRTIFGSDDDPVIVRVRRQWRDILENGLVRFKSIVRDINDITAAVREKSREEFVSDFHFRQNVLERIMAVLDTIDRDLIDVDSSHPFHGLFQHDDYDRVRRQIGRIRKGHLSHLSQLKCGTGQSAQLWGSLWRLATASGRGTLDNVGKAIERSVIASVEDTIPRSEHLQSLARTESTN